MIKSELVTRIVASNAALSDSECRSSVETFFKTITNHLVKGGDIELRGFGRFFLSHRAERTVRNPKNGETMEKSAFVAVRFRTGKMLRSQLNADPGRAPVKR
jgi:nucleoid DNA-binding protein